ncbi:MAG: ferredoxin-NAD reductase [Devosia sp.]|nr:ferredoxin-NAD reductase [Devosia sp.]
MASVNGQRINMAKLHLMTANGVAFSTRTGEVILDSALMQGIEFPHDCRVGRCGSCLARVVNGVTLGGNAAGRGMIHACQARALSDLELEFDHQPPVQSVNAQVASLIYRASDVIEVGLKLTHRLDYLPGQYCSFKFRGFPARSFSPTLPADGSHSENDLTLHVKQVRNGRVSIALGRDIQVGHKLKIEGPFGSAYYRDDSEDRLVLVASGTGFAPILSVLLAALEDSHKKPIVLVIGARNLKSLYMASALSDLNRRPEIQLIVATNEPPRYKVVRHGAPIDFLPALRPTDGVYAAGSPAMIDEIARKVGAAGANLYADPFEPAATPANNWLTRNFA